MRCLLVSSAVNEFHMGTPQGKPKGLWVDIKRLMQYLSHAKGHLNWVSYVFQFLCPPPRLCHLSGQPWEHVRLQPQLGYIDSGIKGFLSYYWEILSGECPCHYSIFSHQPYHHLPHWHYPPSLNLPLPTRSNTSSPRPFPILVQISQIIRFIPPPSLSTQRYVFSS